MSMIDIRTGPGALRRVAVGGLALGAIAWSSVAAADEAIANLVDKVTPAVVTVYSTQEQVATDDQGDQNQDGGSDQRVLCFGFHQFAPCAAGARAEK